MKTKLIIGVTGTNGSGKGTVVDYLTERGFAHFSMSDFIAEEVLKRGQEVNRNTLIEIGNDLRRQFGPGYVAHELYQRATQKGGNAVIESLRTEAEIDILKKQGGFYMIAVDADPEIRYERITARGGVKDLVTFEQFVKQDIKESNSDDHNKTNLIACMGRADYAIINNGTIEELNDSVGQILKKMNNDKNKK